MKKIILLLVFLALVYMIKAQTKEAKLVKTKITDKISVSIPSDFTVMPDNEYAKKYGAYRKPLAMYTSPDGKVNFGINVTVNRTPKTHASSEWKEEDLNMIKGIYKSSIAGMHAEVTFIQDKIQTINKRKFIVLEFIGVVRDEENTIGKNQELKQYSYIQYAVDDSRIVIFNFTCPAKMQQRWQETAKNMMQTVKVGSE